MLKMRREKAGISPPFSSPFRPPVSENEADADGADEGNDDGAAQDEADSSDAGRADGIPRATSSLLPGQNSLLQVYKRPISPKRN